MRKHFALAFCLCLMGCTDADWDRALNYVNPASSEDADVASDASAQQPEVAAPHAASSAPATVSSTSASAQPANADFCRVVAMQDASSYGFDQATQQRVYARSYGQCVAIYSR
jgi:hypothetical protein